jgi:hypothetical protein
MKLVPTKRQWTEWSLPSQISYIGFLLAALGIPLWAISYFWPRAINALSDQPQLFVETTAKPYLRCTRIPGAGIELTYELCIRNSGKDAARSLKYEQATQVLYIGNEHPIVADSRSSLHAPIRLASGDRYCQIFSMRNRNQDLVQIEKLLERYNAGEVAILLELKMSYEDAFTGKKYFLEERNRVGRNRIDIQ